MQPMDQLPTTTKTHISPEQRDRKEGTVLERSVRNIAQMGRWRAEMNFPKDYCIDSVDFFIEQTVISYFDK